MTIKDVRGWLAQLPADMVFPSGFAHPHSWRGAYDEPAVEPCRDITVAEMLAVLDRLTTEQFTGYKGGEFGPYHEGDTLHLSEWGRSGEDVIGPVTLQTMIEVATGIPNDTGYGYEQLVVDGLVVQLPGRPYQGQTDGRREQPRTYTGDDSVPCRWWRNDFGFCARCGSRRPDLHDGLWDTRTQSGVPWNTETRRYLNHLDNTPHPSSNDGRDR